MTRQQAREELQGGFDLGPGKLALLNQLLQRSLDWVATRCSHLEDELEVVLVDGTSTYSLTALRPVRLLSVRHVTTSGTETRMSLMHRTAPVGEDSTYVTVYYAWLAHEPAGDVLGIWPVPDAEADGSSVWVRAKVRPPALTTDATVVQIGSPIYEDLFLAEARVRMLMNGIVSPGKEISGELIAVRDKLLLEARIARDEPGTNAPWARLY